MEDLVAVSVSDPGEEPRVRESALERVVLSQQRRTERLRVRLEGLETTALELAESFFSTDEMQRCPFPRARLGQKQRSGAEIECGESDARRDFGRGLLPVETRRDHQVEDEEKLVLQLEDDALSEPSQAQQRLPFPLLDGG